MPLHARISELRVDLAETGQLAPGEQLRSERYLARLFGVSFAPVRRAMLDAVNKGLLVRDRGLHLSDRIRFLIEPHRRTDTNVRLVHPDLKGSS